MSTINSPSQFMYEESIDSSSDECSSHECSLDEYEETEYYYQIDAKRKENEQRQLEEEERIEAELVAAESPEDDSIYPKIIRETFDEKTILFLNYIFNIYKDDEQYMKSDSVEIMVRSLYYNPTKAYLNKCMQEVDKNETGLYDQIMFLTLLAKIDADKFPDSEIIEAFRAYDPQNTGIIKSTLLEMLLTTKGEQFNKEELEEFLNQGDIMRNNNFDYIAMVERLNNIFEPIIHKRRAKITKLKKAFMKRAKALKKNQEALEKEAFERAVREAMEL